MSMALRRGLRVIEEVSREPLSYGELMGRMDNLNPASLTRLLQVLTTEKYLVKQADSGRYALGPRAALLGPGDVHASRQLLIDTCDPLMRELSTAYDVTCLLMGRAGDKLANIHRTETEFSPFMQKIGFAGHGPQSPWFKVVAAYDDAFAAKHFGHNACAEIAAARRDGYCLEDSVMRPNYRRLGFPVFIGSVVVAVLGLGGSSHQISDKSLSELIHRCTGGLGELGLGK